MSNPDDDLLMREINGLADEANEQAPGTVDISLYAATYAAHFKHRTEDDIREQIKTVFRDRKLFWAGH